MGRTDPYLLRCTDCGTRNRIPPDKARTEARCGKCGQAIDTRVLAESRPRMVTDRNFDADVLRSPLPVMAFFWAPWCPTCVQSQPTIDRFAAEAAGRLRVVKINVDSAPATAQRYDIRGVPFIVVFDGGRVRDTLPGALDGQALMARMARFV